MSNAPSRPPSPGALPASEPITMWVAHCPFRKNGTPVLGNMGTSVQSVVVMTTDEWKRLCEQVPALAATPFRVGTFE